MSDFILKMHYVSTVLKFSVNIDNRYLIVIYIFYYINQHRYLLE